MNEKAFPLVRGYQAKADPIKTSDLSRSEAIIGFPPDFPLCSHKTYVSVADSSFSASTS